MYEVLYEIGVYVFEDIGTATVYLGIFLHV
jgi:hypothetical protein